MEKQKPYILCIEDDETSQLILHTMFTQIMVDVEAEIWPDSIDFENKIASIKKIPQLIIMDIKVMPINGYRMIQIIREKESFKETKVVAFTAGVMPEQVQRLKDAGFEGLISKPIVREIFPQMVDSLLAGETIWYIS